METYIAALDQGTTSSRAILFDGANPVAVAQKEFTQIYPQAGYVEHDAEEIYHSQEEVMLRVLRETGIRAEEIAAIGIIVAVLNQLLIRSGREDQAMMTTLAGLVVVLSILVKQISALFVTIKSLFAL